MASKNYETESLRLSMAIDIAIIAFETFPPKLFTEENIKHVLSVHKEWKNDCLNPEPKYRTLASLKHIFVNVFTSFQEGSGETVEYFWKEIKAQNLGYVRENKLEKILKRGKIKNMQEYDFIVDVIVPYKQEGMISDDQVLELNNMIAAFEAKKKK